MISAVGMPYLNLTHGHKDVVEQSGWLCQKPYGSNRHGCPNYGKRDTCPPRCKPFYDVVNPADPTYVIYTEFNIGMHAYRMSKKHPEWTEKQCYCLLYWQPTARKQLRNEIERFRGLHPAYTVFECPEAMGLNVDKLMGWQDIQLEWPPRNLTYRVAVAGVLRDDIIITGPEPSDG